MNTPQVVPNFKKADLVLVGDIPMIVIAKLQGEGKNPPSYSVCNAHDLKGSQHGVALHDAIPLPVERVTDEFRRRATYFL